MRLRISALAVAATLALAACSSSGGSSDNNSPTPTTTTTAAVSSPSPTGTTAPAADVAAYCAKVAQLGTEMSKLQSGLGSLSTGDTATAKQTLQEASGFFTQLQQGAPVELQSSLTTLASALQQAEQAFTSSTPDTSKLGDLLTSVAPAIETFTQWSATNCTTTPTGTSS